MSNKKLPLGVQVSYPKTYDPNLLVSINREESRKRSKVILKESKLYGLDSWTAYELSWLKAGNIPQNAILYVSYDSNSPNFIESKSFKLYLNSLNNKCFREKEDLISLIKKDLEDCVLSKVKIEISDKPKKFNEGGKLIDDTKTEINIHKKNEIQWVNPIEVKEILACSTFRSLCPVTSQPDWATITITYLGQAIKRDVLLSYLISFRDIQAFHEECVEKIFFDLQRNCTPKELTVQANFLRRGGIELNPVRSNKKNFDADVLRDVRQ